MTSYTRQSSFSDGDTITAALFNDEYNQILGAFAYASSGTTGHRHDGTAGEGGNIHTIGDQNFLNKIVVDSTNNRWGIFVEVSSSAVEQIRIQDGAIVPVTDNDIDLGTSSLEFKDGYFDGTVYADAINFNGTAITATAAELNIMDGVTSTAAELNILDGVTSTAAELNILDGVTSTAAELNILDGVTASATDINLIDGITNGTVIASKVIITDANKDISGGRNITISGELDAATLDISGNADIDGVLETDGLSINGTVVTSTAAELNILDGVTSTAAELNILDGVTSTAAELNILDGVTSTAAELNILDGVTSTAAELNILDGVTSTAAEINLIDGGTSRGTTAVASGDGILINDDGTMRMTNVDTVSTYFSSHNVGGGNIVTTGALNSGSITSGFGAIDNGSSAITTTGTVTFGSITDGTITATAFVDEDDMSSDSATLIPTQQSVKAYVDGQDFAATSFVMEDGDGTEVTITKNKEMKFVEGGGIDINWTDTDNGTDGDPYDLTFTINAAQTDITSIYATDLIIGEDAQTAIDFGTANEIDFKVDNAARLTLTSGALYPVTDNQIDLGTSSLEFKDAYFDGTVTADAFAGPLTGNVTGNVSGTAATVTTAAQSNITSLGTLTTLTVDNVVINGATIGHGDDTDLMTVADGILTVAGEVSMTTLDIGGTNVTSTAAELNILDGVTSTAAELNILDGVTSTAAELNALDGITAVVGELNALDIGSTAVGTAVASKAVILDSNKDYTGVRNLTITGEIDAATGDFSGAVDVAGATTTAAITASGIIKTDDTTAATSTTDGSLQTDGGLSVAGDAVIGDDVKLLSDASVIALGADGDVTITHVADTGIALNTKSITGVSSINSGQIGGSRNKVMNGAMVIDQRNAGASVTPTNGLYTLDRWQGLLAQASKYTVIQSATAPAGFIESLKVTSSSAYSLADGDYFDITQYVEGQNMADLAWGTASAATVTLSFYVRSSLTGTFGGSLQNNGQARSYPFSYAISSADTWEKKSITIAGDTSGTWLTTNGRGIQLNFSLGTGATFSGSAGSWAGANYLGTTSTVSVVSTNAATWYVTGVQLEKGSTATDFEYRSIGEELALCQRYFSKSYDYDVAAGAANTVVGSVAIRNGPVTIDGSPFWHIDFPVAMRDNPTVTTFDYSGNSGKVNGPSNASVTATTAQQGMSGFNVLNSSGSSVSNGDYYCNWQAASEL